MKLNFKTIFIALSVSAAAISCSDFGVLNSDPTKSTDMDPNLLLPTLQMTLTNDWQEWHRHFMYPGGFVQQWCGDWGTVEYGCCGIKNDSYMAELWLQRYTRMAKGLVDIVERTKDDPAQANINAAGRLMLVYTFAQLTDMYGDIPYSEAGKGYYTGQYKPKYDTQEEIYNDFFRQLEIADAQLRKGTDVIKYDQYYDGDTAKWRKYVNSLRLRLALRLIKVNPDKAKEEACIAIENGVMESNEDLCRIKYENFANPSAGPGRGNALSNRFRAEPRNFRFSRKLISYMEQTSDPRIRIYGACYLEDGTDITDLVYEKTRSYTEMARYTDRFDWENYGDDPTVVTPDMTIKLNGQDFIVEPKYQFLQPSLWLMALDAPYVNMSYAEVELLLAEAAYRWGFGDSTPAEHFSKALRASVEMMTVYGAPAPSEADVTRFIQANPLRSGSELEQINMQMWVGLVLNPFESFANWRRTGVPEIIFTNYQPARNQSNGKTPRRLTYPVEEQIMNPDNYREAIARVPGYDWTEGVWWDKQ